MIAKSVQLLIISVLSFIISSQYSISQEYDEFLDMSLEELMNVPISIATKTDLKLDNAPGIVTVLDRQTIELSCARTLADIIRLVPGFDISKTSLGWGEPLDEFYVRGNVNIFSQSILITLNGRNKLNDMVYGSPWMSTRINIEMIEKVEIIRGPGSALYGGNAFSAVINIITRDIGAGPATIFEVSKSQYNGTGFYGLLKREIAGTGWNIGAQGKYFYDGGTTYDYIDNEIDKYIADGTYDTSFNDYKQYITDGINPSYDLSFNLTAPDDFLRMQLWYTNHNPHAFLSDGRPQVNGLSYHYNTTQLFYNIEIEPVEQLTIAAHYSRMTWDANINYGTSINGLNNSGTTLQLNHQNQVDIMYHSDIGEQKLLFGFSYSHETMDDPLSLTYDKELTDVINYRPYYSFIERNNYSLYVQDNWELCNTCALTLGVRYDYFDDLETYIFNPRFGFVWQFSEDSKFKVLAARAFRPPSGFETSGYLGNMYGDANLKPEKITTTEIAFIHYFDFARFQASAYYNLIEDPIDLNAASDQMINLGNRNAVGAELELQGKFWWINYSYSKSKYENNLNEEYTTYFFPPHMINACIHYTFFDVLTLRNQVIFRSTRPNFNPGLEDYDEFLEDNFSMEYKHKNISLVLGARNIFDQEWECPLQYSHDESIKAYPYRGREIFAKVILDLK